MNIPSYLTQMLNVPKEFLFISPEQFMERYGIEISSNSFIARKEISISYIREMNQFQDIFYFSWEDLYRKISDTLLAVSLENRDKFVVFKSYADILDYGPMKDSVYLQLQTDFFLSESRKIVIPELVYSPVGNPYEPRRIIEWKCGACGVPNPVENRTCDHCGSPRTLLVQEIMHNVSVGKLSNAF